jgi:hypothetical protein
MYHKFDVTGNLFLHSAYFNGSKHTLLDQLRQFELTTCWFHSLYPILLLLIMECHTGLPETGQGKN